MWPSDSEIMNTTLRLIGNRSEPESTRVQGLRMLQDIVEDTLLANGTAPSRLSPSCPSPFTTHDAAAWSSVVRHAASLDFYILAKHHTSSRTCRPNQSQSLP